MEKCKCGWRVRGWGTALVCGETIVLCFGQPWLLFTVAETHVGSYRPQRAHASTYQRMHVPTCTHRRADTHAQHRQCIDMHIAKYAFSNIHTTMCKHRHTSACVMEHTHCSTHIWVPLRVQAHNRNYTPTLKQSHTRTYASTPECACLQTHVHMYKQCMHTPINAHTITCTQQCMCAQMHAHTDACHIPEHASTQKWDKIDCISLTSQRDIYVCIDCCLLSHAVHLLLKVLLCW